MAQQITILLDFVLFTFGVEKYLKNVFYKNKIHVFKLETNQTNVISCNISFLYSFDIVSMDGIDQALLVPLYSAPLGRRAREE